MGLDEFARQPTATAITFCFVLLVMYWGKKLPSLLAENIKVIQNNTNVMIKAVESVDKHNKNSQVEFKGLSESMTVLKTNVIGLKTDVQEIKSTMVTKQELSQVQDTVSKIYGMGGKF